ncbi:MAG: GxxExxY protein [Verrucomicrobiota bacterium]
MDDNPNGNAPLRTGQHAEANLLYPELSRTIIGAAMEVSNKIGPGLREKAYERALCLELAKRRIPFCRQKVFEVRYDGELIDTLIPDLIVNDCLIVDTKVVSAFDQSHESQMLTYLQITQLRLAILLNFKHRQLAWKRIVR